MCLLRRCQQDSRVRTEPAVECEGPEGEGRHPQHVQPGGQPPRAWGCCIRIGFDSHEMEKGSLSQRSTATLRRCLPETLPPFGSARKDQGSEGTTGGLRCPPSPLSHRGSSLVVTGAGTAGRLEVQQGRLFLFRNALVDLPW